MESQTIDEIQPTENLAGGAIIDPNDAGAKRFAGYEANKQRADSSDDSDWGENAAAFLMSSRTMNGVANIWDWAEFDAINATERVLGQGDDNFKKAWDVESQMSYLDSQGFGIKYLPRISKAVSKEGLASITSGIHQDEAVDKYINEHTTQGWQTAGTITGALLDADILIPFGKVNKARSVLSNLKKPMSAQLAWEFSHSMVNDDYTTSDAILSFAGMSVFSAGITKWQLNKINNTVVTHSNTFADAPLVTRTGSPIAASGLDKFKFSVPKAKTPSDYVENFLTKNTTVEGQLVKVEDTAELIANVTQVERKTLDEMFLEIASLLEDINIKGANKIGVQKEIDALMAIVSKESNGAVSKVSDIPNMKIVKEADGTYSLRDKNGRRIGKPIAAAIAIGLATQVQAGEGDTIPIKEIGAGVILLATALIGASAYKAWAKQGGSVQDIIKKAKGNMSKSLQSVKVVTGNKSVAKIQKGSAVLRTRLTETYQRFADHGGVAQDMADRLLVNFANGTVNSAEIAKRRFARIAEAGVAKVEDEQFKMWLEAQGMKHQPMINFIENNHQLHKFRQEITDIVDGGTGSTTASAQGKIVAKEFQAQMKQLHQELVDAGVKGYAKKILDDGTVVPAIKYTDDYVPRYWKTADIRSMISLGGNNRELIAGAIAEMALPAIQRSYKKYANEMTAWKAKGSDPKTMPKNPYPDIQKRYDKQMKKWKADGSPLNKKPKSVEMQVADSSANNILKGAEGEVVGKRGRVEDNSIARLEKQMADEGIEMSAEMRKTLQMESDKTARAMYKIELDYTAFKPFKIMDNGKEKVIDLGKIMDRDSHSIMSRYANEQGGNIALGKAGYASVSDARLGTVIGKGTSRKRVNGASQIKDLELREDMNMVIDSLAGVDMVGMTKRQKQRYEVMTGVAFVAKLPLVTVSMMTEYAKILTTKSGFHSLMNQIVSGVTGRHSKNSMFMDELSRATGQGTASLRHEVNPKGLDDISNMSDSLESAFSGTAGAISNTVRQAKEGASRYYGLLRFSDFLQKHAMVVNSQVFAEMIYKSRKMSPTRMLQYGITKDILDDFKASGLLKIDADGYVTKLDWEKFTPKQKDTFTNINFRMGQNLTQETTLGGTGLYMHNDYMFKSLSYLLTFPAEAFSNHGLRDIMTGDVESFRSMFAMYMGGYMSLKMRYAIEGKDVEDDVIAYRALTGLPIFGAISTATGITDPVVLSFFQNAGKLIKLSEYEQSVVGE